MERKLEDAAVRVLADYAIARRYPRIQKEKPISPLLLLLLRHEPNSSQMDGGRVYSWGDVPDNMSIMGDHDYGPCLLWIPRPHRF